MTFDFDIEPPIRCPRHEDEPSLHACGNCITAEEWHREWARAKAIHDKEQASRTAHDRAHLRRLDIANCGMCDDHGYAGIVVCHHDPDAGPRATRWREVIEQVLATPLASPESTTPSPTVDAAPTEGSD